MLFENYCDRATRRPEAPEAITVFITISFGSISGLMPIGMPAAIKKDEMRMSSVPATKKVVLLSSKFRSELMRYCLKMTMIWWLVNSDKCG